MNDEIEVYTFTMAKIYTDQGHLSKAEAIYRHLLEKDSNNQILKEALASVAAKQTSRASQKEKDLAPLFKEWITLAQQYNRMQQQKKRPIARIERKHFERIEFTKRAHRGRYRLRVLGPQPGSQLP